MQFAYVLGLLVAATACGPREPRTPIENHVTGVAKPKPAPNGVEISTIVKDAATEAPIANALVVVLKPAAKIETGYSEGDAAASGRSNASGEVALRGVLGPGTYSVIVRAPGYEELVGESILKIDADTPAHFDPWGAIRLRKKP